MDKPLALVPPDRNIARFNCRVVLLRTIPSPAANVAPGDRLALDRAVPWDRDKNARRSCPRFVHGTGPRSNEGAVGDRVGNSARPDPAKPPRAARNRSNQRRVAQVGLDHALRLEPEKILPRSLVVRLPPLDLLGDDMGVLEAPLDRAVVEDCRRTA